jgi:phosphoribosylamine-glycine ligase
MILFLMIKWSNIVSNNNAKDLFQLQSELIDGKVDMAVSKAIERVMDKLSVMDNNMHSLRHDVHVDIHNLTNKMHVEMHGFRRDMDKQFSTLGERVTAVESTLTYVKNAQTQISTKFIDYTFKAGWLMLGCSVSYVVAHFFGLIS